MKIPAVMRLIAETKGSPFRALILLACGVLMLALLPSGLAVHVAGILAACLGVITLPILGFRLVAGDREFAVLAPSGIAVAVSIVVFSYSALSFHLATKQFEVATLEFQSSCHAQSKCPLAPDGWTKVPGPRYQSDAGVYATFPLFYISDGLTFTLVMKVGPDLANSSSGGVTRELSYQR